MDPEEIGQSALRLLAAREHSMAELRRKLQARGGGDGAVERVLAGLQEQGLLSDVRFVTDYVAERLRKGFGPLRIRSELRERGIEAGLIAHGLELDEEVWMEVLTRAHDKKFGAASPSGRAELARCARFLEYRGFTAAQVGRFLRFDD